AARLGPVSDGAGGHPRRTASPLDAGVRGSMFCSQLARTALGKGGTATLPHSLTLPRIHPDDSCFSCAEVPTAPLPPAGQQTGRDLGLESFATLSHGTMLHNPHCYCKTEAYPRRCQRRVARRKNGSH